ncbi:MerR family transcriptional regulator (plasmid) [Limimaricola variabilis]
MRSTGAVASRVGDERIFDRADVAPDRREGDDDPLYENREMIPSPARTDGSQRRYDEAALERLAFLRHTRELDFGLDDVAELMALAEDQAEDCAQASRGCRKMSGHPGSRRSPPLHGPVLRRTACAGLVPQSTALPHPASGCGPKNRSSSVAWPDAPTLASSVSTPVAKCTYRLHISPFQWAASRNRAFLSCRFPRGSSVHADQKDASLACLAPWSVAPAPLATRP